MVRSYLNKLYQLYIMALLRKQLFGQITTQSSAKIISKINKNK